MNSEYVLWQKFEVAVKEIDKLNNSINEFVATLGELKADNAENMRESIEDYKKSKENLLKMENVELSDQRFEKIAEQYEIIRAEQKGKKQLEILKNLSEIRNSSKSKVDTFVVDIKNFVFEQEQVLKNLNLERLIEIVGKEKKLYAIASANIKENTSLLDALQGVLKDQKVKVTLSTECDGSSSDYDDAVEDIQEHPQKETSVVLYKLDENMNTNDLSLARCFLAHVKLDDSKIVDVHRIGRKTEDSIRPLKVTFADDGVPNQLLEIPTGKISFNGRLVRIAKYSTNLFDHL